MQRQTNNADSFSQNADHVVSPLTHKRWTIKGRRGWVVQGLILSENAELSTRDEFLSYEGQEERTSDRATPAYMIFLKHSVFLRFFIIFFH